MYFKTELLCNNLTAISNRTTSSNSEKEYANPRVWVISAGYVLYWLPKEDRLVATSVTSNDPTESCLLYMDEKYSSPVVDVHFGGAYIFVVLRNAHVHVYSYLESRSVWREKFTFHLRSPDVEGFVRCVSFNETSEYVCWCNEEGNSYKLFWRSLPSVHISKSFADFVSSDTSRVILSDTPLLSVKCMGNTVCVVPKKPVNVVLMISMTGLVRMFNAEGKLLWLSSDRLPINFWELLRSTYGLWESQGDYVICENLNLNQRLYSVLTKKGNFLIFSDSGYICKKVNLLFPEDLKLEVSFGMCLYSRFVFIFFTDRFCISSTEDGKFVQSTLLTQFGSVQAMWTSLSSCPTFGFFADNKVYRICIITLEDILNSSNGVDSSVLLSGTFYNDSAFLTLLQSAVNRRKLPPLNELLNVAPPLQSHAILLALLQHCSCSNFKERSDLVATLSQCTTPGTRLDKQLQPLVQSFLSLEKYREQLNGTQGLHHATDEASNTMQSNKT